MLKKILAIFIFLLIQTCAPAQEIEVEKCDGIYVFKIPMNKYKEKIKPYVSEKLTTTSDLFNKDKKHKLIVNGGFFDPKTGNSVSEVIIDKKKEQTIFSNLPLVENLNRQNRLEKVLNRSELRILEDEKNRISFDITNHLTPVERDKTIKHSIQAGPMIFPKLQLEEESFITYRENKCIQLAADVLKKRERTILGLKKGYLYIVLFTTNHKADLKEARDFCKKLGLEKAVAMDGGASTSINYKDIEIFSCNDNERRVKSFLVIEN